MASRRVEVLGLDLGELLEEHRPANSREDWSRWADDPVGWERAADRDPVDYQIEVMRSVVSNRLTAWRACHSAGKEFTAGSLAVWAAYARGMLVLVVSATERQVLGQTMREVRRAWRAARDAHGIGGQLYQGSVRIGGEDRIIALTGSANVDALTGWHDPTNGVLVVISEGQGEALEAVAYEAAMANANTARGRILAMGNPVRPTGRFYEIHRRAHWARFQTSAFNTPNVKAGKLVRPGFPGPDWPAEMAREYGADSSFYVSRVLAEFPDEAEDALVTREGVEAAVDRFESGELEDEAKGQPYALGVDPAALGPDATATTVWQGPIAREYHVWRGRLEATDIVRRIQVLAEDLTERGVGVGEVYVDAIGVGFGVASMLKENLKSPAYWVASGTRHSPRAAQRRPKVVGVNWSKKPADASRFVRRKDELMWGLREALVDGRIALAPNADLVEEILAARMRQTPAGRIEAEPKDRMRARLGRSPDLLDSLLLGLSGRISPRRGDWRLGGRRVSFR